jgi:hypothetical protein
MRGALAADAQRAAGAVPTAQPFTRTTRRSVPTPPLRIRIVCEVSGSMVEFAGTVASAAWILAHAARHTTVATTTATVIIGDSRHPTSPRPPRSPRAVRCLATAGLSTSIRRCRCSPFDAVHPNGSEAATEPLPGVPPFWPTRGVPLWGQLAKFRHLQCR